MSASFEAPAQYDRDLRSANKEWKRGKDAATKWSFGSRPLSGCRMDWVTGEAVGGSEAQRAKTRPRGKASDEVKPYFKKEHNVTKFNRGNYTLPAGRVRTRMSAHEEISSDVTRSISDLVPGSSLARTKSTSDNFMYSFDRTDSPGRSLTLDVFIKPANPRDTERFVEKEYEILDANGQALRGHKARRNLRKAPLDPPRDDADANEDEGFELV